MSTTLFVHIPKAGGTTFRNILQRQYENKYIETISHNTNGIKGFINRLSSNKNSSKIKLIKGHMPFGLHQVFAFENYSYITMMREPAKRLISHFYYEKIKGRPYYNIVNSISLEEYISSPSIKEFDNCMTRYYANCLDVPIGELTDKHFSLAKNNLDEHFSLVLIMEEFDKSLLVCKNFFNWPKSILYSDSNANTKIRRAKTSTETLRKIEAHLKYDIELYQYGKEMFEKKCKEIPNFNQRHKKFMIKNRIFKQLHPLYSNIKIFILRDVLKKDLSSYV